MKISTASLVFLSLGTLIAVFNWWGVETGSYDRFFWYDSVAHIAGGAWVALGYRLFVIRSSLTRRGFSAGPGAALVAVAMVGVLWEVFEVAIGFPLQPAGDEYDVVYDLSNDLLGGVVGAVWPRLDQSRYQ